MVARLLCSNAKAGARLTLNSAFYGTFEGALKGLVIHVMATHDTAPWIGRMRVLRKTQNHGRECPARGYFRSRASGSATPLRPSAWSFSHHARARDSCARRLGAKLSGNIKARSLEPLPSRTMIVP